MLKYFAIFLGDHKLTLRLLNRYVRTPVGKKWHDLGIELLNSDDVDELDKIAAEHPKDLDICCTKMFQLWLQKQAAASWDQLIEALKQPHIDLGALVAKIEENVSQLKCQG